MCDPSRSKIDTIPSPKYKATAQNFQKPHFITFGSPNSSELRAKSQNLRMKI